MQHHPLVPLTSEEIQTVVHVLKQHGILSAQVRIISITLYEDELCKQQVYAWNEDNNLVVKRQAEAVVFDNGCNRGSHVFVDIDAQSVKDVVQFPVGAQPTISVDEMFECEAAVINSDLFRAALKRHYGNDIDPSLVMVDIWSAGNYGSVEESSTRLARPLCFLRADATDNGYAHPIEGLRPVVDLNLMQVLRVEDYGMFPLPPASTNYSTAKMGDGFRADLKPLTISQPEGPNYVLRGNHISWQKFDMVIGFTGREGLVIHDLRYIDGGRSRPIVYRASLTEMVVPYGEPSAQQARKNAFDVGEYGIGYCANSLVLGCDCVGHIDYLDGQLCTSRGQPFVVRNAVCVHEEDYGIVWKHTDRRFADAPEVRRSRRLVVSSVSTVENYEYGFFWYFYQDGNVQFEVKLTGILSLGVWSADSSPIHGTILKPLLYAPNHQHFFNMRIDIGIDGMQNRVYQCDIVADDDDCDKNPFCNAFHLESTLLSTEAAAKANLCLETGRTWKFASSTARNALGDPTAYKFMPGDNAVPYASKKAWWRKRAGFVDHHVWVTPYRHGERYAAGEYPNQGGLNDGLGQWTQEDRPISDTDCVFWYTFGHNHIPRPEDIPVMPTAYVGWLMKPSGFFDVNPANDLPPTPTGQATACCAANQ